MSSDPAHAHAAPPPKPEAAAAQLTDIQALTFLFLWWRATDAASSAPVLNDVYAGRTWARCETADMRHPWMAAHRAPDPRWVSFVCHRTRTMDQWTQAFINRHTAEDREVQVLHVGCGLDARHLRVQWGRNVRWVDVDLPALTDLRRRIMPPVEAEEQLERKDYWLRTLDITVEGWYRDIPADRPTLFIAENLICYLPLATINTLFPSLVTYFSAPSAASSPPSPSPAAADASPGHKGQLIFDASGTLLLKYRAANLKNTTLKTAWAIDDARRDMRKFHPTLKLTGRVRWQDYAAQEGESSSSSNNNNTRVGRAPPPLFGAWTQALAALRHSRLFKEALQVLRYDFGGVPEEERQARQSRSSTETAPSPFEEKMAWRLRELGIME